MGDPGLKLWCSGLHSKHIGVSHTPVPIHSFQLASSVFILSTSSVHAGCSECILLWLPPTAPQVRTDRVVGEAAHTGKFRTLPLSLPLPISLYTLCRPAKGQKADHFRWSVYCLLRLVTLKIKYSFKYSISEARGMAQELRGLSALRTGAQTLVPIPGDSKMPVNSKEFDILF